MPQEDVILYLKPLRPIPVNLVRISFHKFYFALKRKFADVTLYISVLDPWLESVRVQELLSKLLNKANKFIITIDDWYDEGFLEKWMAKDANRLWELVVKYVYRKRGLKV